MKLGIRSREAPFYLLTLLILGIGFVYAKPLAMLIDYSISRMTDDPYLTVANTRLPLPKGVWVLDSEGPGAVIGFLRGFGQVDRMHILPRPDLSPERALARKLQEGESASTIEAHSIGAAHCLRRTINREASVIELAAYCPAQGVLIVVDADQSRAWDRAAELFP